MNVVGLDEQPSDEGNPFCSVRQLLEIGESVGEVATAIEAEGIFSWDRFGRYCKYGPKSVEATRCLELLANEHELRMSGLCAIEAGDTFADELRDFGWAAGALPTQQANSMRASPPASHSLRERERTTLLLIISALVNEAGIPERTTAAVIARCADKNGAPVTDETVRKWLRLAEEARQSKLP